MLVNPCYCFVYWYQGIPLAVITHHVDVVNGLRFDPLSMNNLVSVSDDGTARLWKLTPQFTDTLFEDAEHAGDVAAANPGAITHIVHSRLLLDTSTRLLYTTLLATCLLLSPGAITLSVPSLLLYYLLL